MSKNALKPRLTPDSRTVLVLFAIALGIRVLASVLVEPTGLVPDPETYELGYAKRIASGFEWISRPMSPVAPGYPVLLAVLYLVSAKQLWLMLFFQSAIGALTVVGAYRLGRQLLDERFAVAAAIWVALLFNQVLYSVLFLRDVFATLLFIIVVFLVSRPFERMRFGLFAGLVYGALVHVDPQYLLLGPLFGVFILFYKSRHLVFNVQYFFVFVLAVLAFSTPWTIRNHIVYGQPIPIGLEASRFLRPVKAVVVRKEISEIETRIERLSNPNRSKSNVAEFWRFARFHDEPLPGLTDQEGKPAVRPAWSVRHNVIGILSYGIPIPFFLLGLALVLVDRNRFGIMLGVMTVAYFLVRVYLGGSERARLPIEPLVIVLAFYGVAGLLRLRRGSLPPQPEP